MNLLIKSLLSILFLFIAVQINSAEELDGRIKGIVIDVESNDPIESAIIQIVDSEKYTVTSADGVFHFENLSAGLYKFQVSHVSYYTRVIDYNYNSNTDSEIIIYLEPRAIEIAPVIVSGIETGSIFEELQESGNSLKGRELDKNLGNTLAFTLKNETGLAIRSMGPAPARPGAAWFGR